jgi:hypothetical protein
MRTKTFVGLLSCIALALCLYGTPAANAASAEEEVLQVEINWVKAMNTSNYDLISTLYWRSPKITSFPPNSFLYQGWDTLIADNFKRSSSGTPTTWSLHHPQVMMLTDNVAVLTGYHRVVGIDPATKAETETHLRFTRVVQKIDGKWLIVHDHGSGL